MTNYQFTGGTICAPATIPGTGAISIIRVSGKEALAIADKVIDTKGVPIAETEGYRLRYGTVFEADGSVLDNVIVSVFRAPHSYTGENSCHASRFIVNKILELLVNAGARIAAPGEFTRRAFVNGKMDLAQAEAVADVIASQSAASHRVAMNQLKGGFSSELKVLRRRRCGVRKPQGTGAVGGRFIDTYQASDRIIQPWQRYQEWYPSGNHRGHEYG